MFVLFQGPASSVAALLAEEIEKQQLSIVDQRKKEPRGKAFNVL